MREEKSGISREELFSPKMDIAYSDFKILNTIYSDIEERNVSLKTHLGKDMYLNLPIIASPMDKVTNADVSIGMALQGGIGVIHYNYKTVDDKPDIDAQISEIEQVKRHQSGFITNPITVSPENTIEEAIQKGKIGGKTIETFPVTENGEPNGKLLGMLRKQDYRKTKFTEQKVYERMFPLEKLVTGQIPLSLKEANNILWDRKIPTLPIIDDKGKLVYLVTQTDIEKAEAYPYATRDENNRLSVLFAVDTRIESSYERLERGFAAGADGVVVDTSQGFKKYSKDMLEYIQKKYPEKLLIGGNVSTKEAVKFLEELGIDAYRNGQGSGSSCTTIDVMGTGRAGASGVYDGSQASTKIRTIADGGLKTTGDIFKSLSVGADVVMLGNMLAGLEEGPGEKIPDPTTGLFVKTYRGMGSKEAGVGGARRGYGSMPQGVSGTVEYKGSIYEWIPQIIDSLRKQFTTHNCKNISELHNKAQEETLRYIENSLGAKQESGINIRT